MLFFNYTILYLRELCQRKTLALFQFLEIMKKRLILILILILPFTILFGTFSAESEFFKTGLQYYQNGEFEIAAAHFEEAKKFAPRDSKILFYLGNCYYQINELDKAILNFTEGLNYTDKKAPFFYNLGNCYYLKGNYQFSQEMYLKAASHDPDLYDSYLNAGNAYYKTGDYAQTVVQWETYLNKYPQTPQYENIKKAIAYLKEEIQKPKTEQPKKDEKTGLEPDLLKDVMSDLEKIINRTENVLEKSARPQDDLSMEEIER